MLQTHGLLCRFLDLEFDCQPGFSSEADQGIYAEIIDPSTEQIIEAGLGDVEALCGGGLRQIPGFDMFSECDEQVRSHGHGGGFLGRVHDGVPDIGIAFDFFSIIASPS
jgi:hypothetical protein